MLKFRGGIMKISLSDGVFCRGARRYLWYLAAFFAALFLFLLCEIFISEDVCHAVWSPVDDMIPFIEGFVVFYTLWYFMIVGSLLWLGLFRRESFRSLLVFMTACQMIAIVIFVLYPNKQLLRPEVMPRDNIFSNVVGAIHSVDTNTNVCPSLHVCYSAAMASVWLKERSLPKIIRFVIVLLCAMACVSTVFIKQHSIIDMAVGFVVCAVVEMIIYRRFWKEKFTFKGENEQKILNMQKR